MNYVFIAANASGIPSELAGDIFKLIQHHHLLVSKVDPIPGNQLSRVRLTAPASSEPKVWKKDLISLSDKYQTDLAMIPEENFNTPINLAVFDMDSTLIRQEVIDEMAVRFGIGDQVKAITKRAMNGELNFDQSLSMRVSLLKGLPLTELCEVRKSLTFTPGVPELITALKKNGIRTVIASGGFTFFAEEVRKILDMDEAYANVLEVNGDILTGNVTGEIVNASYKASLLESLARREQISAGNILAVGDGANDIPMLLTAGMGFAFHAKEKVRHEANHQLHHSKMDILLSFINMGEIR